MGLTYSLFLDFTLYTRKSPSPPGYTSITRPSGQSPRLASGSIIITTSPFFRLCLGWNHLFRQLILGKNSLLHLFQNIFRSCCTRCHLFFGLQPLHPVLQARIAHPTGPQESGWGLVETGRYGLNSRR